MVFQSDLKQKVVITDQLPKGLTYVKDSLTSVGDEPKPNGTIPALEIRFKEANGTITKRNTQEEPEVPVVHRYENEPKLGSIRFIENGETK